MNTILKYFLFLSLGVAGVLIMNFILTPQIDLLGSNISPVEDMQNTWKKVFGYAATLLGVLLGAAYKEISLLRENNTRYIESFRTFFSNTFRSIELWAGLFTSPIIFAILLQNIGSLNDPGLFVIALENGFCSSIITTALIKKREEE